MRNTRAIPWRRITVESIAIVASILLAFGIDAWWDDRIERSNEQKLLDKLSKEFSTNLERIDAIQDSLSHILDASSRMFGLIDEALVNQEQTVEIPTGMLRLMLIATLFEADVPVLEALTKAGKLDVVDDFKVIAAVSEWERQLRDYTASAERSRRTVDALLLPALYKRGDIGPVLMAPYITSHNATDPMWTVPVVIRVDVEIKGIVANRFDFELAAQRDFEHLRSAAAGVVEAIDAGRSNP